MKRIETLQIGGGVGSLIGESHRIAMQMDNKFQLVGGVFNRSLDKSLQAASAFGLGHDRVYADVPTMLKAERGKAKCVSICTPNDTHFSYTKAALEAGFHVVCDKPLAENAEECEILRDIAKANNRALCVTFNYSGYPMVREAREQIAKGDIGKPLIINFDMPQSALSALKNSADPVHPRMQWRIDVAAGGGSMVMLDLMTHIIHLAEFVTGMEITSVSAQSNSLNNAMGIEDDVVLTCRWANGAVGRLWSSFVATGNEHGLAFSIYGDKASLHWKQSNANALRRKAIDTTETILTRSSDTLSAFSRSSSRFLNHPEGFFEAFANIYSMAADEIRQLEGENTQPLENTMPTGYDAIRGLKVVEAAQKSIADESRFTQV